MSPVVVSSLGIYKNSKILIGLHCTGVASNQSCFCGLRVWNPHEIHWRKLQQFWDICIGDRSLYKLVGAFKNGQISNNKIVLHYHNTCPYKAASLSIRILWFKILQHPLYCSNLTLWLSCIWTLKTALIRFFNYN